MIARVAVSDMERARVSVGDAADVRFDAAPERTLRGAVRVVGASPLAATGAYEVEIGLADGTDLPSGLVGTATVYPAVPRGATAVPMLPVEALVEADGDSAAVFVVTTDLVARRRTVRVGALTSGSVPVMRGLTTGERVVVAGGAYLADGLRVRVTSAAGPERAP
jgi:multidrug efflux pump subunit AcrA (membrane-fusion protein)